ncbi:23S rRNA (guanosine(2251)-2'-O)-methyltransferase RlmB [Kushneria aurantia]|uniref:23S rRNA (Guanosine(2251)-2'-O)-methyltransferase RlmB n=1 Tax=Kushneria aurantia TaxID=504092 RepID=A0ABV6G247_9GAMM|nr:23S rRNA (guanosine(2251)-2'-O)-methyltransferase RlmB [Kushneria aurantia]
MAAKEGGKRRAGGRQAQAGPAAPRGLDPVHGVHAVETLFDSGHWPSELWLQEGRARERLEHLIARAVEQGVRIEQVARERLDAVAEGAHQGVVAFCPPLVAENEASLFWHLEAQKQEAPLLLVLDGVTDVHNFGACLRSAAAAGAVGVVVSRDRSAPLNATVRKIACGGAEGLPVYQVTNLARTLARLRDEAGLTVVGAAGEARVSLYDAELSGPLALVMGAEGKGLRPLTRERCDVLVKLPMAGQVSSLNVSVATGICLFEAVRQRAERLASRP